MSGSGVGIENKTMVVEKKVTTEQKLLVLVLLVAQNASVSLLVRYSRGVLKETYLNSTVVTVMEIFKVLIASFAILNNCGESYLNTQPWSFNKKLYFLIKNGGYSWIPAICYFAQNTLQYVALENLTVAVYACLQQFKIISAAILSFIILKKKYHMRKWRALILLCLGGILMEYHTFDLHEKGKLTDNDSKSNPMKGTIAILLIVAFSGFAGVMTQKLLKNKNNNNDIKFSIWDRNFQMSFYSIFVGIFSVLFVEDRDKLINRGFFGEWSHITVMIAFLYTMGGILVAFTIKYTDVVVKGFASAISLIFICVIGSTLLGDTLDIIFTIGASITVIATFNYSDNGDPIPSNRTTPQFNSNVNNNTETKPFITTSTRD